MANEDTRKPASGGDERYLMFAEVLRAQDRIEVAITELEAIHTTIATKVDESVDRAIQKLITEKVDLKLESLISVGTLRSAVTAALDHQKDVLTETIKGVTAALPDVLRREIGKVVAEEVRINLRAEVQRAVAEGLANMAPVPPVAGSAHISVSPTGIS